MRATENSAKWNFILPLGIRVVTPDIAHCLSVPRSTLNTHPYLSSTCAHTYTYTRIHTHSHTLLSYTTQACTTNKQRTRTHAIRTHSQDQHTHTHTHTHTHIVFTSNRCRLHPKTLITNNMNTSICVSGLSVFSSKTPCIKQSPSSYSHVDPPMFSAVQGTLPGGGRLPDHAVCVLGV